MNKSYSTSAVIGSVIVAIGLMMLIRNVFNIHIPIFTLLLSFGMIWLGIKLIRGNMRSGGPDSKAMFGEGKLNYLPGQDSYSVTFGSGTLNLQDIRPEVPVYLNLDCSFGEMKVFVSKEVPLQIIGSATFGSLHGPDLRSASFGNYSFISETFNPSLPGISIHARVSFGELRVFYL